MTTGATSPVTPRPSRPAPAVRTRAGCLRGTEEEYDGRTLYVFRGVPYARPPVGPLRFSSPRPVRPWTGVRDATAFSPPFLQPRPPGGSEDALYANVWTPGPGGRRPVLVYIHGGGFQVGAADAPAYDGAKPAARGDLVVVTFNYRLGAFGWGLHEDLTDPRTGDCANWGLQDQTALLHWVRDNAEAFGGDPGAVTLCGTSAGAVSARLLAGSARTEGIVKRLVAVSAALPWAPALSLTTDDARTAYEELAAGSGTTVAGLRYVPAEELQTAWLGLFGGPPEQRLLASGREYRGPVVDGRTVAAGDPPLPPVPVMSVHCRTEGSFFTDPHSLSFPPAPPAPANDHELRAAVRDVLLKCTAHVPDEEVAACVEAYRAAAAVEGLPGDPLSLWTEVWGDALLRHQIVRLAERHAAEGRTPQYVMEFAHPVRPPHFGTPHDATSKFLFGTHAHPTLVGQFGDGPLERRVSDAFVDLVASFARCGTPGSPHVPHWPEFTPGRPSTLILGGPPIARIGDTSTLRRLRFWDGIDWLPGA
ncbi:carboxylesterase/lipase family protein [Streptomyces decoyicus]|uniref:carboxylesterase/lipase family protein n=1 Tax=Streptomyces decoyicus TaxID=249567 RepID=UPI00069D6EF6|nr:carboxylesterase family protein [Streptomyces decoyicus]KOG38841.1 carboxylesterase [Streptomyces decoyicus]QZY15710.1 carboxylesterase family protein [Streptomyces decoyicus]